MIRVHARLSRAMRLVLVAGTLLLTSCSNNNEEYRTAKREAYERAYWPAYREAYAKAYQPTYKDSAEAAYNATRQALVGRGQFSYKTGWLVTTLLLFTAVGFFVQHRLSARLRRAGMLQGDIDRLLLGEPSRLQIFDPYDSSVGDSQRSVGLRDRLLLSARRETGQ